ncbi:MAG: hypothetical protein Q4D14_01485 [Bacteroidales bacterium]|nr:hypothetical protein [Bacteroidales bacterium]
MQIIATNKILLSSWHHVVNMALVLNDAQTVVDIIPLVKSTVEQSFVIFYSGVITAPVDALRTMLVAKPGNQYMLKEMKQKFCLCDFELPMLSVGYSGELWLWQDIDANTLIPSNLTTVKIINS